MKEIQDYIKLAKHVKNITISEGAKNEILLAILDKIVEIVEAPEVTEYKATR